MRIERTKNATRNIAFGVLLKIYQIIVPFLLRSAMIYSMGVQYLGLDSLFVSILQMLNLAELGVGSAMIYSMYKPIVDDNAEMTCALMKLYRMYYRCIGIVIAVVGMVFMPFVPRLIKSDLPGDINVYVIYILNLGATVLSYWLFAYKNSLFQAHQRVDVISKVALITKTIQYAFQIITIFCLKNYYIYLIIALLIQVITNIVTAILATKMYPNYKPKGCLEKGIVKDINQRIRDLFTSKLGAVVVDSADTVVISAFLGLEVLAVYQNYYFILTSVIGLIAIVFNSCTAGIGNSLIVETKEKNFNDLKKLTFLIIWLVGICSCCFLNLYQPFMEVWVGKEYLLEYSAVISFCIYFLIYEVNKILTAYKDAGGIWHKDRYRPLVTAIVNLVLNLVLVQIWGIYGILFSTVLSTVLVGMPWLFNNIFSTIFEKKYLKEYLCRLFFYIAIIILAGIISGTLCSLINANLAITLVLRVIISFVVPNIVFLIFYYRLPEFKQSIVLIHKLIKRT